MLLIPDSNSFSAGICIWPGQSAALPVITEAATAWHGMFVCKQTADGGMSPMRQSQQYAGNAQQRNRLSFLHVQLEGQQGTSGPLLLDTLSTTKFEVGACFCASALVLFRRDIVNVQSDVAKVQRRGKSRKAWLLWCQHLRCHCILNQDVQL